MDQPLCSLLTFVSTKVDILVAEHLKQDGIGNESRLSVIFGSHLTKGGVLGLILFWE